MVLHRPFEPAALIRHFSVSWSDYGNSAMIQPSSEPTLKQALLTLAAFTLLGTLLADIRSSASQAKESKPSNADKIYPETYADPEAYAVYAAVLPKIWNWELHEPKSLVFREETEFSAT